MLRKTNECMKKDPPSAVILTINQLGGTHAIYSLLCSGSTLMPGVNRFERAGVLVSDLPKELEAQPRLFFHLIGQAVSHIIFLVNHYELGWFRTNYRRITPRVLQQGDFLSYRITQ